MAIYTGVADANGDFTVPFSSNYTSGQKVTVTAEKDSALKTIELFAPTDTVGGGAIQFGGTLVDFPKNIGVITLSSGISEVINSYAFASVGGSAQNNIFRWASGLVIAGAVTDIKDYAFTSWINGKSLTLPSTIKNIGAQAFYSWTEVNQPLVIPNSAISIGASAFAAWQKCPLLQIGSAVTTIAGLAFGNWSACMEIKILALVPPAIQSSTFVNLNTACIFKVPADSVAAYQAAPNWSAFAAKIQAI